MTQRQHLNYSSRDADAFLAQAGWKDAVRKKLAGDASFRRYDRVYGNDGVAVLMDAPPDKEDVVPFVRILHFLRECGLSAPELLASDEQAGYLLLEDLGDNSFSSQLAANPAQETDLYSCAVDLLLVLHGNRDFCKQVTALGLPNYDAELLMREVKLFSEWYLPQVLSAEKLEQHQQEFNAIWRALLEEKLPECKHFVHRDYHADNLMWLPERKGVARVGLLDYQDAVKGHAAYDLASLLEDARRDLQPETATAMLRRYIERAGVKPEQFLADYALLAAQRNCKIVGIFVRLAVRDGKQNYLDFLPRVWGHLLHDLAHPRLAPLAEWVERVIPSRARGAIVVKPL